jgi:hypothetical protein
MVNYICERCNKQIIIKCIYTAQINRKYPCKKLNTEIALKLHQIFTEITKKELSVIIV